MADSSIDPFELDVSNDPEVERLGANAAVQYAVQFWNQLAAAARKDGLLLDPVWDDGTDAVSTNTPDKNNSNNTVGTTCQHTKELQFTESPEKDYRLYRRFRSNLGPYWNVEHIRMSDDGTHNPLAGEKWTALLLASDGVVPDYNFMTLLRSDCHEPFWMTETDSCDGLLVVPRAQFVFVELSRCREGCYGTHFRRALQRFDIKTASDQLEAAVETGNVQAATTALHHLKTQWPYPTVQILKVTGAVRVLKGILAIDSADSIAASIQAACRDQLQQWHDLVALGKLTQMQGVLSDSQSRALQRAAKALTCSSSRMNDGPKPNEHSKYTTKNTANLSDLIVSTLEKKRTNGNMFAPQQQNGMSAVASVFHDYGVVVLPNYCSSQDVAACQKQSQQALKQLQDEQLTPRGLVVDGDEAFDFVEVRQRPGHRVDNRYKIVDDPASPIAVLGRKLMSDLSSQLFSDEESGWKLLYAGVVHSFPRKSNDDHAPPPQLWHRDGPSMFAADHHHPTHCFNVFVPLVDVSADNGTTEFVPGTHEDSRYNEVAADVILDKPRVDEAATVRADVAAGSVIAFDIRVLHRGLSNQSSAERPVLYFTFARDWFQEQHMFQKTESLRNSYPGPLLTEYAKLCRELYHIVTGKPPRDNGSTADYGHPHYTTRFDLLLLEQLTAASSVDNTDSVVKDVAVAAALANIAAVLSFCNASNDGEKDAICGEFVEMLESEHALVRKRNALEAARQARRTQHDDEYQDFASIQADMSDVAALYKLTAQLLFEGTTRLSKVGFTKDEHGVCNVLALLKAYAEASETGSVGSARLEDCFTSWWHAALSKSRFELISSVGSDQVLTQRKLLVVFSSLGSGIARPEWQGTLRAIGAQSCQDIDILHVMDFAFSWFCQDPTCEWKGGKYYEDELKSRTEKYQAVFFLGDSMGAAGALRFSTLADTVVAFTPQVDISSYEALTRTDFSLSRRQQFQEEVIDAVSKSKASITVHYGGQCEEDIRQVQLLPHKESLHLVEHDYDDHILSLHLRDQGKLTDIVADALQRFLVNH